jgi:hypothetical protein
MSQRIEDQELLQRIAQLPREIQPQNDPWESISARIGQRRAASSRGRAWALPAAAAATVALALVALSLLEPRGKELAAPATSPMLDATAAATGSQMFPVALASSESEYQAAFREFISVGRARPNLSQRTLETIETGWAELRAAENALARALEANPNDRFLNTRMLELRARQLGFLQQLASLDQSNRRLTT